MSTSSDERLPVEVLAEEFLDRLRRGEQPTVAEYAQRYPEQAAAIRELFPAMLVLERLSVPDPSERPLLPETSAVTAVPTVLGDYRLLRPIGWGGMGIVFEAEDVSLGRHVAVKVLPPEPRRDDVARQRFLREAQVAASLHHSNIVPVFGAGQQAGWHYYVMQLVSGSSLDRVVRALRQLRADREAARETAADSQAARLAQRMWNGSWAESSEKVADRRWDEPRVVPSTDEPSETSTADAAPDAERQERHRTEPPAQVKVAPSTYWRQVASVGAQAALALQYAHEQGVLHRDIKPSNLLLDEYGGVWLTDFGLGKARDRSDLTRSGELLGTLNYLPPEALRQQYDARSDVYSLGVTLYELATLAPALGGTLSSQWMHQMAHVSPPRLERCRPDVPRDLATIIHKACDREPQHRYATAGELASDLRRFLAARPIHARRLPWYARLRNWMRENRGLAATLSALLLLSLACGVGGGTAAWIYQRIAWENARLADDAHRLSRQLRQERDIRQRALADMYASFGLQQAEQGEPQEALSWFVQAAAASPEGSRQRQTNEVRMQTWYRQLARPVSLLPGGFSLRRLRFHPGQRCLLAIPYNRRQPDRIWDWDAERVWPWPQECGSVTALDWTPDGERVALGNAAGEIWWCPFPAGSPVRHREGSERISTLVWDPAGQRLAVAAGTKVWIDVEPPASTEGTESVTLEHAIDHLCFSPDGQYLLVTTDDRQVHVLNGSLEPPRPLWSAEVDWSAGWVKPQPQFTANSAQVILVRPGNRLSWFSLADGTLVREVPTSTVNDAAPYELQTSTDRSRLAVACLDQGVRVFATDDGRPLASLPHHGDMAVCFGRTPDQLLTAGANRKAVAWSLAGEPRGETQALHSTGFLCVQYSADYQFLATCGYDHRITVWQLPSNPQHTVTPFPSPGQVRGWFTPRGGRLYLRQEGAGVSVVDPASRQPVAGPWRSSGHLLEACSSRDDRRLACLSLVDDQTLQVDIYPVADPAARGVSQRLPAKPRYLPADGWYGADQIQWTPDGRRCVVLAFDQLFALDAATGRIAWEQKIHGLSDHGCLSPRGDQLVNYSAGGMEVRDTADGSRQFQLPFRALSAAITTAPRGVTLAAGGWDGVIRFWDLETGQSLSQEIPHPSWIEQLEFSDDGQYLVSCCKDHGVRVWDRARLQLAGPPIFAGEPCIARLSPDDRWLATATAAGRFDIWDWREGRRVCPSYRLDSPMFSQIFSQARNLQWSRQGRRLFCGGRNGEAVVLDVEIESIGLPALLQPQREWAQVLAMARMGEESRLIPLSSDEWRSCWQSLRTRRLEFLPVRRGNR